MNRERVTQVLEVYLARVEVQANDALVPKMILSQEKLLFSLGINVNDQFRR